MVVLDEKDGQAIVSVRDTGSSIAPEIYPNLFTKFATKSERGTGLGLFFAIISLRHTVGRYEQKTIAMAGEPHLGLACPYRHIILLKA